LEEAYRQLYEYISDERRFPSGEGVPTKE